MAEKKVAALVFSTTDFFGNIVRLGTKTWREHVIVGPEGHPEMAGYENLVKEVLEEPSMVRLAGFDTSLAFIRNPGGSKP